MSIQIYITGGDKAYVPGAAVNGVLQVSPSGPLQVTRLLVRLLGSITTQRSQKDLASTTERLERRVELPLFVQQLELVHEPCTISAEQTFQFVFVLPFDCRQANCTSLKVPQKYLQDFNQDPTQPLPPTLLSSGSGAWPGERLTAAIQYRVKAHLETSDSKVLQAPENSIYVISYRPEHFRNYSPRLIEYPLPLQTRLANPDPKQGDRSRSFSERMKSSFKKSDASMVSHSLVVEFPDIATLGETVPIYMGIRDAANKPPVELKRFTLFMVIWTYQLTKAIDGAEEYKVEKAIGQPWQGSVRIDERLDLSTLQSDLKCATTPDFISISVTQRSFLKLVAKLQIGNKSHDIEIVAAKHPFTVVSPICIPVQQPPAYSGGPTTTTDPTEPTTTTSPAGLNTASSSGPTADTLPSYS